MINTFSKRVEGHADLTGVKLQVLGLWLRVLKILSTIASPAPRRFFQKEGPGYQTRIHAVLKA